MRIDSLFLIAFATMMQACTAPDPLSQRESCYLAGGSTEACFPRPKVSAAKYYFKWACEVFRQEPWWKESSAGALSCHDPDLEKNAPRPEVGLASGGGGTKAGPFAVGVMKRLVDEGWISEVDILSSVSGGGYGVPLLYTRQKWLDSFDDEQRDRVVAELCGKEALEEPHKALSCLMRDYREVRVVHNFKGGPKRIVVVPSHDLMVADNVRLRGYYPLSGLGMNKDDLITGNHLRLEMTSGHVAIGLPVSDATPEEIKHLELKDGPHNRWSCSARSGSIGVDVVIEPIDKSARGLRRNPTYGGSQEALTWYRCFQDLMANDPTSTVNMPGALELADYDFIARGLGSEIWSWPSRLVLNWLWDQPINPTWTHLRHRLGAQRLSHYFPEELVLGSGGTKPRSADNPGGNRQLDSAWRIAEEDALTFADLRRLAERPTSRRGLQLPVWIANSATHPRPILDFRYADVHAMDLFRFEVGPYSFGSPLFGHVTAPPEMHGVEVDGAFLPMSPLDGMLASQAALSPRQRIFEPLKNAGAQLLMEGFAVDWSVPIENYRLPHNLRDAVAIAPFPLHLATRFDEPSMRSVIHLGDGGFSRDNLGILALLERRTKNIIVLDQTDDVAHRNEDYLDLSEDECARGVVGVTLKEWSKCSFPLKMVNLCETNSFLMSNGYEIVFSGRPDDDSANELARGTQNIYDFRLAEYCTKLEPDNPKQLCLELSSEYESNEICSKKAEYKGFPHLAWTKPVWVGRLASSDQPSKQLPENDPFFDTHFFLIKAAVNLNECEDWDRRAVKLAEEFATTESKADPPITQLPTRSQGAASYGDIRRNQQLQFIEDKRTNRMPLSLCAWLHAQYSDDRGRIHDWPQHDFIGLTVDTSFQISMAYVDLGWYAAGHLQEVLFEDKGL